MAIALNQLLQLLVQSKGSDLHVAALSSPMIRVRGEMMKVDCPPLQPQEIEMLLFQIINSEQKTELHAKKSLDFAHRVPGVGVYRVNIFYQRHGLAAVFRALAESPPTIQELRLPQICETVCSQANGLVLVCGPTGSGKSTTLAAMLNFINSTTNGHILTLEDPVEFLHETKKSMMNQRSLGQHFTDFASALKAALREDPDVILVGEMRDPETIALALKAAETGHLVFSTLHTNSASKTVDRIINTFPAEEQTQVRTSLSETLRVVISQKLVPSVDKKRRICFFDILVNTSAVANLIREGKTFQIPSAMQTGTKDGMQMLDKTLLEAVHNNEVEGTVAWEFANDKAMFSAWAPKNAQFAGSSEPIAAPKSATQALGAPPSLGGGNAPNIYSGMMGGTKPPNKK